MQLPVFINNKLWLTWNWQWFSIYRRALMHSTSGTAGAPTELARVGDHAYFPGQHLSLLRLVFSSFCPVLMRYEVGIWRILDLFRREYGIGNYIFAFDAEACRLISSADTCIRQQFQICHRLLVPTLSLLETNALGSVGPRQILICPMNQSVVDSISKIALSNLSCRAQ